MNSSEESLIRMLRAALELYSNWTEAGVWIKLPNGSIANLPIAQRPQSNADAASRETVAETAGGPRTQLPHLTSMQRKIMEVLTDEPVTSKRVAGLAGYGYDANFRRDVAGLARMDLIDRTPDGLRRKRVVKELAPGKGGQARGQLS